MISEPYCTVPLPGAGILITLELKLDPSVSLQKPRVYFKGEGEQAGWYAAESGKGEQARWSGVGKRAEWRAARVGEQAGWRTAWVEESKKQAGQMTRTTEASLRNSGAQTAGHAHVTLTT
jgi:hypothetical protein